MRNAKNFSRKITRHSQKNRLYSFLLWALPSQASHPSVFPLSLFFSVLSRTVSDGSAHWALVGFPSELRSHLPSNPTSQARAIYHRLLSPQRLTKVRAMFGLLTVNWVWVYSHIPTIRRSHFPLEEVLTDGHVVLLWQGRSRHECESSVETLV